MSASQHIESHTAAPVDDLRIAHDQAAGFVYEASRVAVALRSLAEVMGDEENRVEPAALPGLGEAVALVGEHMERYALDCRSLLETIAAERQAGARPFRKFREVAQ